MKPIMKVKKWLYYEACALEYKEYMIEHNSRIKKSLELDLEYFKDAGMDQHANEIQNQLKKQPIVDPETGGINLKYNPMNIQEDYYLVTRSTPTQEESVSFTPKQN